jgi:hypothetical protein
MSLTASGIFGELKRGYQTVARLTDWKLDADDKCEATAADVNTFWFDQPGPMALWLKVGKRFWVWRETEILSSETPFVIRVIGSPDVRD